METLSIVWLYHSQEKCFLKKVQSAPGILRCFFAFVLVSRLKPLMSKFSNVAINSTMGCICYSSIGLDCDVYKLEGRHYLLKKK